MKRMNEVVSRTIVVALFSLAVGAVWAQEAPAPATQPAGSTDLSKASIKTTAGGRIESLSMPGMDINTALQVVATATKKNIVVSRNVSGSVNLTLYDVTMEEVLNAMLEPNGFGYIEKGNFLYVYTLKEMEDINNRSRKVETKVFKLKYLNAKDAKRLITDQLSKEGKCTETALETFPAVPATDGGGSVHQPMPENRYAGFPGLVVMDFPLNLSAVTKLLGEIDVAPKQVLIDCTILTAQLSEGNDFGLNINVNAGIGSAIMPFKSNPDGGGGTAAPGVTKFSLGYMGQDVSVVMNALEGVKDINVLANPKLLVLDNRTAGFIIKQNLGYGTVSVTNNTQSKIINFIEGGTVLTIQPTVSGNNLVRLSISLSDSTAAVADEIPSSKGVGVSTEVMVKDSYTAVLGGILRESNQSDRSQVPGLGNIPILGIPFRGYHGSVGREEVILFMTPHIVKDTSDDPFWAESLKTEGDGRRMQMGMREALMPIGRNRLANMWYIKAVEAKEAGAIEKAAMYADWAVNCSPQFIEAIKLRQELTGIKLMGADNSSIQSLVREVEGVPPEVPVKLTQPYYPKEWPPVRTTAPIPTPVQAPDQAPAPTTQP